MLLEEVTVSKRVWIELSVVGEVLKASLFLSLSAEALQTLFLLSDMYQTSLTPNLPGSINFRNITHTFQEVKFNNLLEL